MALKDRLGTARVVLRSTIDLRDRPHRLPQSLAAMARWGTNLAGLVAGAAARFPDRVAVHDESGSVTYGQLWDRANAQAVGLIGSDLGPGSRIGILARNHVGFVEWLIAAAATGADVVLLNTGFAGPQLAAVVEHESLDLVIHDDDFTTMVRGCGTRTLSETGMSAAVAVAAERDGAPVRVKAQRKPGAVVILTSGTTGRPKGAARQAGPKAVEGLAAMVERIPVRPGDVQVVAAPLFHAWGLTHLLLGLGRSATHVLTRRFDAESTLHNIHRYDAGVLVVVPVMLARMLSLPAVVLERAPTPSLRIIASSGSAISSALVTTALDHFGPVLYNLYGSTEVAAATIATPDDLLAAPSTAGRPAMGVRVEVLDGDRQPVPEGEIGEIFVGGSMRFDGYTDGTSKEESHGLLSTGDVGYFRDGLLFVEGRADDMIVSGGENVYPHQVEDLLAHHPDVADVAVVGVPDDEFGQALAAFVVLHPDASLDADGVRALVRDQLARHQVPRRVHFRDELPRNTTGKVLRQQLATDTDRDPDTDTDPDPD